ncbi:MULTISPECIES: hypothetical protein [unclassified Rhizobium]|uniref:hypothetical protein n=1 Tax=unclassified Rhizobium TaxID=2613769 RepID=UPI00160DA72C|nr:MULTISPECIES: hypothetical protein [unclassified Rhizobium]MBB3287319.1 hypothetical protein [Rhizobium sp. BK252]MBB3402059.1 hypothetical protein [Rhizobium sp. BK289]MBB3414636.1 hypothetical protein [Rhizobium sp. BK284]MBB3482525.1 hypothetical protein [Rhizobium sp. BK347]
MPPDFNLPFVLSVAGAFLTSSVVAYVYVWPAIRAVPRYEALRLLAAFHAFRFLGMNFLVSGIVSSELSSDFAYQVGWGDFIAAVLALVSMAALSWRWPIAIPIVWIFNVWGTMDLLNAYYMGITRVGNPGLFGAGIYIPALFVPLLLVNHGLAFTILWRKRALERAA